MEKPDASSHDLLPEERAIIQRQRYELQIILRFLNRNYVYCLCHGKLRQADDLLRAIRGLGDLRITIANKEH